MLLPLFPCPTDIANQLCLQVVSLLLDHVDVKSAYEALLLAIKLGHDEIAEMILEHPKYDEITLEFRSVSRTS